MIGISFFVQTKIIWTRPKIELSFSAPPKSIILAQKLNLPYENDILVWHKTLKLAQYVNQF